tara:strand:- start:5098 stop:5217 length:120 start_codon:yes stop_codon:yes gene_type:complete
MDKDLIRDGIAFALFILIVLALIIIIMFGFNELATRLNG